VPIRLERKRLACCFDEAEALQARTLALQSGNQLSRQRSFYRYLVITPQAIRSPELPDGSVFMSSAVA